MAPTITTTSMTRRSFGKLVAMSVTAGSALLRVVDGSARTLETAQPTVTVYSFYPLENGRPTTCRACLSHAENKRFATREAADTNRAHPGCNCTVLKMQVPGDAFVKMFGGTVEQPDRDIYDLRWPAAS